MGRSLDLLLLYSVHVLEFPPTVEFSSTMTDINLS